MKGVFEAFSLAIRAIRSYRLRAFLTMLGISIGIFAITLTFTLVESMEYSVTQNLSALGNTVIYVHNWPWKDNSEDWQKYFRRPKMSFEDYAALRQKLTRVSAVAFEATLQGVTMKWRELDVQNAVMKGITHDYIKVQSLTFANGRYFTPIETENARLVVILGARLAHNLFRGQNPIGNVVNVRGLRLSVVGVLERQGNSIFGQSQDDNFLVPYPIFARQLDMRNRNVERVVGVRANRPEDVAIVESDISGILRAERGLRPGTEDNFSINKQESLMEQIGQIFKVLNIGGLFISIFSLLVGGFGIANIMFVAVKERTREIGIQKAIGATRSFIMMEFLLEAIVLCLLGAVLGLALLLLVLLGGNALLAAIELGLTLVVSPSTISIGIVFAAVTGMLSGLLPALFAARLDPVEAMRAGG